VIHELSHLALGHHLTLHRGAVLGKHKFYEDSEWQAKALTAALMMSKEAALAAKSPRELAELCGTSVESATYRIKTLIKLGLIPANHSLWEYLPEQ
jgi:Zn-dependent peptidase ImmA (M78 family)